MRSIATKLILVAIGVSLVQAGLTVWFADRSGQSSFERYLREEAQADFVDLAAEYYADNGNWDGIAAEVGRLNVGPGLNPQSGIQRPRRSGDTPFVNRQSRPGDDPRAGNDPRGGDPTAERRGSSVARPDMPVPGRVDDPLPGMPPPDGNAPDGRNPDRALQERNADGGQATNALGPQSVGPRMDAPPRAPAPFALVDLNGTVLVPAGEFRTGEVVEPRTIDGGKPVVVGDNVVGVVLFNESVVRLSPEQQRYVRNLSRAIYAAAIVGLGIALLLSVALSRRVIRSLGKLTLAADGLARGDFEHPINVDSTDEIGTLAKSFDAMRKDLQRAQQLQQQMTADIAHDLRTPLTVLRGYLEAIQAGELEATPERIETMHRETMHLNRLIDDLRLLSLADADQLQLQLQPVDPNELLRSVIDRFTGSASAKNIALESDAEPDLPILNADLDHLQRVLGNLVSNAIAYSPAGGTITLRASASDGRVHLFVDDCGPGIAPADVANLFDRFFRSDRARTRSDDGGSGLGLAICRALVDAHGGTIAVDGTSAAGTSFRVDLPAAG